MPGRKLLLFAAVVVAAPVVAFVTARLSSQTSPRKPTLAELAAKNYRTLSVAESRRLLRYAESEYSCLAAHGLSITKPIASRIRITMTAPGRSARQLADFMTICDPAVGPPPKRASLQARAGLVLVYLPKRCLLAPSEVTPTA